MSTFRVELLSGDRSDAFDGVAGFTGEDASGRFGLLAHHARFMTLLTFGLARLRLADGTLRYVGLPGGLLVFADNVLRVSTRRYLVGDDPHTLGTRLADEVLREERALADTLAKLRRLEAQTMQRLARLTREDTP